MIVNPMAQAELAQARKIAENAMRDREFYVRIVALLARHIEAGTTDALPRVEGHVAVKAEDFAEVPKLYRVDVKPMEVPSVEVNGEPLRVVVIHVESKAEAPILVHPGGALS